MGNSLGRSRHWVSSPAYRATVEVIVAARHESGMSQKALAERLGKPPSFIGKVEMGERRIDLVEFIVIARVLGVSPESLVSRVVAHLPEDIQI